MTQKIDVKHRFNCSAETLFKHLSDDAFDSKMMAELGINKETLEATETKDGPRYRIRVKDKDSVPEAFRSLVGGELVYVETRQWFVETLDNNWKIKTDFMTEKVNIHGIVRVVAVDEGHCERQIQGTVEIKIPLMGKKIEAKIMEALVENFEKSVAFIEKHVVAG